MQSDLRLINLRSFDLFTFIVDSKVGEISDDQLRAIIVVGNNQVQYPGLSFFYGLEYDGEVLGTCSIFA